MTLRPLLFALALLLPLQAQAERYEAQTLLRQGRWIVELTHDTQDGNLWCNAQTNNDDGQVFSVVAYDSGSLALLIMDNDWSLENRSVRFIVDVDRSRWTIDGTADDIGVSVFLTDPDNAVKFMEDLAAGNNVTVYNDNLRRLAAFSLWGSRAALTELMTCWGEIETSNPFDAKKDPF